MKRQYARMDKIAPGDWDINLSVVDGIKNWEFSIEWYDLGKLGGYSPRFEVFDDAWEILPKVPEVIKILARLAKKYPGAIIPEMIEKELRGAGWREDKTYYKGATK